MSEIFGLMIVGAIIENVGVAGKFNGCGHGENAGDWNNMIKICENNSDR